MGRVIVAAFWSKCGRSPEKLHINIHQTGRTGARMLRRLPSCMPKDEAQLRHTAVTSYSALVSLCSRHLLAGCAVNARLGRETAVAMVLCPGHMFPFSEKQKDMKNGMCDQSVTVWEAFPRCRLDPSSVKGSRVVKGFRIRQEFP